MKEANYGFECRPDLSPVKRIGHSYGDQASFCSKHSENYNHYRLMLYQSLQVVRLPAVVLFVTLSKSRPESYFKSQILSCEAKVMMVRLPAL